MVTVKRFNIFNFLLFFIYFNNVCIVRKYLYFILSIIYFDYKINYQSITYVKKICKNVTLYRFEFVLYIKFIYITYLTNNH